MNLFRHKNSTYLKAHKEYPFVFENEEKNREDNFTYFRSLLYKNKTSFEMQIKNGKEENHIYWVNSLREFIGLIPVKRTELYSFPDKDIPGSEYWSDDVNVRVNGSYFSLREIMLFAETIN